MRCSNLSFAVNMDDVEADDFEAPEDDDDDEDGCDAIRDFIELRLERCGVVPPVAFGVTVLSCN